MMKLKKDPQIAVVGLGYVGLPLALAFSRLYRTIGYDIDPARVVDLERGLDKTQETSGEDLAAAHFLSYTYEINDLADADIYVVTVPTPIDTYNRPDLNPLLSASKAVGSVLKQGNIVIYESTVYPGATEEICVPELEKHSGLSANKDFSYGYSPERINPGDKTNRLESIVKLTSGSCPKARKEIDDLYQSIITAGTFSCQSIKVAEAAKVIENTQRDINIALMNELTVLFDKLDLDVNDVLDAASTKWNFLNFRPGLVGGHCIGVDPYYLTHKCQEIGFHPEIILAGRRINDTMAEYVVSKLVAQLLQRKIDLTSAKILILGFTFKENCPDIRNTKINDIILGLEKINISYDVYDPNVDPTEAYNMYGVEVCSDLKENYYDGAIVAVGHDDFKDMTAAGVRRVLKPHGVIFDLKAVFDRNEVDFRI